MWNDYIIINIKVIVGFELVALVWRPEGDFKSCDPGFQESVGYCFDFNILDRYGLWPTCIMIDALEAVTITSRDRQRALYVYVYMLESVFYIRKTSFWCGHISRGFGLLTWGTTSRQSWQFLLIDGHTNRSVKILRCLDARMW